MSKFLRQMTALSKKPSDFQQPGPTLVDPKSEESVPPTVSLESLSVPTTDPAPPTDSVWDTIKDPPTGIFSVTPKDVRRPKPRRATVVQDGHSHAEQAVYSALWENASPDNTGNRKVTIGLGRLSRFARLSENNCRLNIRSLVKKLALEEIGLEDSRNGIGKTYRIFSYGAILQRRKAAGMEWVIRTKGVQFVSPEGLVPPTDSIPHAGSMAPTGSGPHILSIPDAATIAPPVPVSTTASRPEPPTDSEGGPRTDSIPPFRKEIRNTDRKTSSSDQPTVSRMAAALGVTFDDDAVRKLVRRCRDGDPEATDDEIIHFLEVKVHQLQRSRTIENWVGLLIASVPVFFQMPATELQRYREAKATAERQGREQHERLVAEAQKILDDPKSTESDRALARESMGVKFSP
jgi:hypothetical protein